MKLLGTQLAYLVSQKEARQNLRALSKFVILLVLTVLVFAFLFHVIMSYEGKSHSWMTGVYWTLTVMSTLGFGDITFESDLGRAFSVFVLITGIVLLLIVLPFAFIRFFYAPWLEAQIRLRAPKSVPATLGGHVIITHYDDLGSSLVERLRSENEPYVVIEPDARTAAELHADGISVVTGEVDNKATYEAAAAERASLLLAGHDDPTNTNITLTAREVAPKVRVAAITENPDAVDVLELAGVNHVLQLKRRLGEHLAARVVASGRHGQVVGEFQGIKIAEFPVHNTRLMGRTIRETGLRQELGLSVVAFWDRGHLYPAQPDAHLRDYSVLVVAGSQAQIDALEASLVEDVISDQPVLVLGGGKVGRATAASLRERGISVHMVEKERARAPKLQGLADEIFWGEAEDRDVIEAAGVGKAPSVVLTTNDDAINIFLAIYCRRLNPDLHIISRVTHERNVEAMHRAGATFVLSYAWLAVQSVMSLQQRRDLVVLGEETDLFTISVPEPLVGRTLEQSRLGQRFGLNVIGVRKGDEVVTTPAPDVVLEADQKLVVAGSRRARKEFRDTIRDA